MFTQEVKGNKIDIEKENIDQNQLNIKNKIADNRCAFITSNRENYTRIFPPIREIDDEDLYEENNYQTQTLVENMSVLQYGIGSTTKVINQFNRAKISTDTEKNLNKRKELPDTLMLSRGRIPTNNQSTSQNYSIFNGNAINSNSHFRKSSKSTKKANKKSGFSNTKTPILSQEHNKDYRHDQRIKLIQQINIEVCRLSHTYESKTKYIQSLTARCLNENNFYELKNLSCEPIFAESTNSITIENPICLKTIKEFFVDKNIHIHFYINEVYPKEAAEQFMRTLENKLYNSNDMVLVLYLFACDQENQVNFYFIDLYKNC